MNVIRHHHKRMELKGSKIAMENGITIFATAGSRKKIGPVHLPSRRRSIVRNAFPEGIDAEKLRFGGRLPCKRHVRKVAWPTQ